MFHKIGKKYRETALIKLIIVGLILGIIIALAAPQAVPAVSVLGDLFVRALKGIAPVLVFVLVMNALAQKNSDASASMKPIVRLYVFATFCASLVAVAYSFAFPTVLHLQVADAQLAPPSGIVEVLHNLILSVVDNPIHALANANYIGILGWACLAGIALHAASDTTKNMLNDFAKTVTKIVQWVIRFAPFGIMGLVANAIGTNGLGALLGYVQILGVLLAAFFTVALVMNPLIVYLHIHRNPYPLVWTTLKESGLYAFFTRSSAANIPVNLALCERLGLAHDPLSTQVISRDHHAYLAGVLATCAATCERIATECRSLQKTDTLEAEEPFRKGQKGSSAMPHKRNPITLEKVCGLSRVVKANAQVAFDNVALWHERDISHSSAERVAQADSFIALDHMLQCLIRIVDGLVLYPARMRANLDSTRGLIFSSKVLLALVETGITREQAYAIVQRNSMEVWDDVQQERAGKTLRERLEEDPECTLEPSQLDAIFDPWSFLTRIDVAFDRLERISFE